MNLPSHSNRERRTTVCWCSAILAIICWVSAAVSQQPIASTPADGTRFLVVDVLVETGQQPLAAYQLEVTGTNHNGSLKVVGIEGGEPGVFRNAPYYDPAAMNGDRVVIGAFSTAPSSQLPHGGMRIATVHCMVSGAGRPVFSAKVAAAATADGQSIPMQVNVEERNEK